MNRVHGKERAVIVYNTTWRAGSFRPAVSRMMRSGLTTGLSSIFPAWWLKSKYDLNGSVPGSGLQVQGLQPVDIVYNSVKDPKCPA